MDKLISEQAAIETALTYLVEYCGAAFDEDMQRMLKDRLNSLPSAQLEPCEDCVSRKAVIRLLHSGYHSKSMIEEVKELPSAQPGQRWIPCSERLPDNDEAVLISNSHGVTKAWWNGRFWTSIAVKKYKTVIAWMPLPEPYREDANG